MLPPGAGGIFGIVNYEANLGRVSNSISLWLGVQPPEIFFYAVGAAQRQGGRGCV